MNKNRFRPGISTLISRPPAWLKQGRIGLITHQAAVLPNGKSTADALHNWRHASLAAILGPEHGFFGAGGAGEKIRTRRHPHWKIPVYSLYGETRKPTPRMLKDLDGLVVDLCDLSARPYTYVSTLRLTLEAAAEANIPVAIADRPTPLSRVTDGPLLDPTFESFVGSIPAPMIYGMTPAETALWMVEKLNIPVQLHVARMSGFHREAHRQPTWPPWIPPSPGIKTWESAICYTSTVFCEALPSLDCDRSGPLPFQVLGSPWMKGQDLAIELNTRFPSSVRAYPHFYRSPTHAKPVEGIRLTVTNPNVFKPIQSAVILLATLRDMYGDKRVWTAAGSRPKFFDTLFGTNRVRTALRDGSSAADIIDSWQPDLRAFNRARAKALLYHPE